jgi:hypothetical protein
MDASSLKSRDKGGCDDHKVKRLADALGSLDRCGCVARGPLLAESVQGFREIGNDAAGSGFDST